MKRAVRFLANMTAGTAVAVGIAGCSHHPQILPEPPRTLGLFNEEIYEVQQRNAEASKLMVYSHEFQLNDENHPGFRLNSYGEDHVKQLAANLHTDTSGQIMIYVERSRTSSRPDTEFEYPVHFNEELDRKRREVVVASLTALGVLDAEQRVIIAPAFAEGLPGENAARAYQRGYSNRGNMGGGFGGGFGGRGGGGFGGGFF